MLPMGMVWSWAAMNQRHGDLAAYLRTEFQPADAEWAARRIGMAAGPRLGVRGRLARRLGPRREAGPGASATISASGGVPRRTWSHSVDGCPHDDVESLGHDGPTAFVRCQGCGALLVGTRDRVFLLRSRDRPSEAPATA